MLLFHCIELSVTYVCTYSGWCFWAMHLTVYEYCEYNASGYDDKTSITIVNTDIFSGV